MTDYRQGASPDGQRTHAVRMRSTMTPDSSMGRALCGVYVDLWQTLPDTTLGTVERMVSCRRCRRALGA